MNGSAHIVYVLVSERHADRVYTGITSDMTRRLEYHNAGESKHTASGCPWRVVLEMRFEDPFKAEQFELYLKTGSGRAFAAKHFVNRARREDPPKLAQRAKADHA